MDEKHSVDAAHDSPRSFPVQDLEQLSDFFNGKLFANTVKRNNLQKSHAMKACKRKQSQYKNVFQRFAYVRERNISFSYTLVS